VSQSISSGIFIPKVPDRAALRRQVGRALERSPRIEDPTMFKRGAFTMESYCDQLAGVAGRPVRLMPVDAASLPCLPFSTMEMQGDCYVIYYRDDAADVLYRDLLVFRQIARLLCALPLPDRAFPLAEWTGYDSPEKILVETVATNLSGITDRARETPLIDASVRELRAVAHALRREQARPPGADA
jgi:hypothetical protein